ncbi:MAG: diguanylate cyclase [Negativicutes bacterium]|jgi:diguanylate cyclase (GGDEF)-like protein
MKILSVSCSAVDINKLTTLLEPKGFEFVDVVANGGNYSSIFEDEFIKRIILIDDHSVELAEIVRMVELARQRYDLLYLLVLVADPAKIVNIELLKKTDDAIFPTASDVEIVTRFMIAEQCLDDQKRAMKRLVFDPVSGALNEHAVERALLDQYERARREIKALTVIILELDDYQTILNNSGISMANKLARDVVDLIRRKLRRYDVIGRFRDNSFVLILPNCSTNTALAIARRVKRECKDTLDQTASMGVAGWNPGQRINTEMILSEAFNALNIARIKGRDTIETVDWWL